MKAYHALLDQLASLAWVATMKNSGRLYLVGTKRHTGDAFVWDNLWFAPEDGAGDVILPEPIPNHLTRDQLYSWLDSRLRREPLGVILDSYQTA